MVALLPVLMLGSSTPQTVAAAPPGGSLTITVYADDHVDRAIVASATKVAEGLLADAGVAIEWRLCPVVGLCPPAGDGRVPVVVILSSERRVPTSGRCGFAARGEAIATGTVMVSIPCVADMTTEIARRPANRAHPLLTTRRHDDVAGAIVAHEIGHVLGLPHTDTGLMRPALEAADILALRQGRLRFTDPQAAQLRVAAASLFAPERPRADFAQPGRRALP